MTLQNKLEKLSKISKEIETALAAPNAKVWAMARTTTYPKRLHETIEGVLEELEELKRGFAAELNRSITNADHTSNVSAEEAAEYNKGCRAHLQAVPYLSRLTRLFYGHLLRAVSAATAPSSPDLLNTVFGYLFLNYPVSKLAEAFSRAVVNYRMCFREIGVQLEAQEEYSRQATQMMIEYTQFSCLLFEQIERPVTFNSSRARELLKVLYENVVATIDNVLEIISSWPIPPQSMPQSERSRQTKLVTRCLVNCMDLLDVISLEVDDFKVGSKMLDLCEMAGIRWTLINNDNDPLDSETCSKFCSWLCKRLENIKAPDSHNVPSDLQEVKRLHMYGGNKKLLAIDSASMIAGSLVRRGMATYDAEADCSFRGCTALVNVALELAEDYEMKFRSHGRFDSEVAFEDAWKEHSLAMLALAALLASSAGLCFMSSVEEKPSEAYEAYCLACEISGLAAIKPPPNIRNAASDPPMNVTSALICCRQALCLDYHECNFPKASVVDALDTILATLRLNANTRYQMATVYGTKDVEDCERALEHDLVIGCGKRLHSEVRSDDDTPAIASESSTTDINQDAVVVATFCIGAEKAARHLASVKNEIVQQTLTSVMTLSNVALEWGLDRFDKVADTTLSARQLILLEAAAFSWFNMASMYGSNQEVWFVVCLLAKASKFPKPVSNLIYRAFCLSNAAAAIYSADSVLAEENEDNDDFSAYCIMQHQMLTSYLELGENLADSDTLFLPSLFVIDTIVMQKLVDRYNEELDELASYSTSEDDDDDEEEDEEDDDEEEEEEEEVEGNEEVVDTDDSEADEFYSEEEDSEEEEAPVVHSLFDAMLQVGVKAGFISPSDAEEPTSTNLPELVTKVGRAYKSHFKERVKNDKYVKNYKDYVLAAGRRCSYGKCTNFAGFSEWRLKVNKCSGCRVSSYCSKECQTKDWKAGHKHQCKVFKEMSEKKEGLFE